MENFKDGICPCVVDIQDMLTLGLKCFANMAPSYCNEFIPFFDLQQLAKVNPTELRLEFRVQSMNATKTKTNTDPKRVR